MREIRRNKAKKKMGFGIQVEIVEEELRLISVPEHCETIEDVIRHCLYTTDGIADYDISPKDLTMFGLQSENGHWLRPALRINDLSTLIKETLAIQEVCFLIVIKKYMKTARKSLILNSISRTCRNCDYEFATYFHFQRMKRR